MKIQWKVGATLALSSILFLGGCRNQLVGLTKGFSDSVVVTGLELPTVIQFTKSGSHFVVGEKGGKIKMFENKKNSAPVLLADLSPAVYNWWDRGLLGLTLHPNFPETPELWVLYTHDGPIDSIGIAGPTVPLFNDEENKTGPASARLSKLTLNFDGATPEVSEERVLIHDWCQHFPSHSIGSLEFGPDGALYVSAGEAASFNTSDYGQLANFCGDPDREGGSLRSQDLETSGDPVTLNGTILRIDPETGDALPDNPLSDNSIADDDRIIAYGFRNPFRMTFRPGKNELYVGDVGSGTWEEVNRVKIGSNMEVQNFGWPCFEGPNKNNGFKNLPICKKLYKNNTALKPFYAYKHIDLRADGTPCGAATSSISGLAFVPTGNFPAKYKGALLTLDYAKKCMWVTYPDAFGNLKAERGEVFYSKMRGAVDIKMSPTGELYYAAIEEGSIRKIRYGSGDGGGEIPDPRKPLPTILSPGSGNSLAVGQTISFSGSAQDYLGNPIPNSALKWELIVKHCPEVNACHVHFISAINGVSQGTFEMPDHESPSFVEIRLTAKTQDSLGEHTGTTAVRVDYSPSKRKVQTKPRLLKHAHKH